MKIVQDDYTFAKSERQGVPVPFGTGGDCFSGYADPKCRKGENSNNNFFSKIYNYFTMF